MEWKSIAILAVFLVAWFSVNRWILPIFGVSTCISGKCAISPCPTVSKDAPSAQNSSVSSFRKTNAMRNPINLSDSNFESEVLRSTQPVLVDFWAPWCGPCRMIGPVVEELMVENSGIVKVGKVNVDNSPGTAANYGINSIPTVMLFDNGKVVSRFVGVQPKARLQEAINRVKD